MSASAALSLRTGAVVLAAVLVQLAAVSQIPVLGVTANLFPLVVAAVGLLAGAVPGAVCGFAIGLLGDLPLLGPLGISSLVYLAVGYLAGRVKETADPASDLVPLVGGAAATALALMGYALLYFLLGVTVLPVGAIAVTVAVNAVLALPVHAAVRWALGPALPDGDARRGRTPRSVRGGLSPLFGSTSR